MSSFRVHRDNTLNVTLSTRPGLDGKQPMSTLGNNGSSNFVHPSESNYSSRYPVPVVDVDVASIPPQTQSNNANSNENSVSTVHEPTNQSELAINLRDNLKEKYPMFLCANCMLPMRINKAGENTKNNGKIFYTCKCSNAFYWLEEVKEILRQRTLMFRNSPSTHVSDDLNPKVLKMLDNVRIVMGEVIFLMQSLSKSNDAVIAKLETIVKEPVLITDPERMDELNSHKRQRTH